MPVTAGAAWAATLALKFAEAVLLALSFTRTTNENVPACVGMPEMIPVACPNESPLGRAPEEIDQL